MKHHYLSMELIALLCFSVSFPMSGATNQEGMPQIQSAPNPAVPVPTEAHRLALETAGGFARDGFRIRDAEWAFVLAKGMTTFLKVTPELSGPYFVGVELVDSPSNQPLEFSLVSVYK